MVFRALIARHHVSQDTAVRIEDAITLRYLVNTPWAWKCPFVPTRFAGESGTVLVCTHATNLSCLILNYASAGLILSKEDGRNQVRES